MDELLEQFLHTAEPEKIGLYGEELSSRGWPEDVPPILEALQDPLEYRRWMAVRILGFSRLDRRVTVPLMNVLANPQETIWVRSQAAECLGYMGQQRAIKALIRASRDPSPDLRFWSVFALGQVTQFKRKQLPRAAVRALEARLTDDAIPIEKGWWPVRLEALAMLNRITPNASVDFDRLVRQVLDDPVQHARIWPWAQCYVEDRAAEQQAIAKITAAGLDPVTLGRS